MMTFKVLGSSLPRAQLLIGLLVSGCARQETPTETSAPNFVWVDPSPDCSATSPRFLPPVRASDTVSAPTAYDPERLRAWLARRVPRRMGFWHHGRFPSQRWDPVVARADSKKGRACGTRHA